jgi:hypothetical protein
VLLKTLLALGLAFSTAACGRLQEDGPRSGNTQEDGPYEATATVLEDRNHGPMLCLGAILTSLPPQCGDVPLTGWDWKQVDGEKRQGETIWGDYHVVGTFDGTSFTVTEVEKPKADKSYEGDPIETPCPEPEGGWRPDDAEQLSEGDQFAAMDLAQSQPDFAGLWVDYIDDEAAEAGAYANPDTDPQALEAGLGPGNIILNAAFTGDLERHESEIREVWSGALCVVQHERSLKELLGIQRDLDGAAKELDLEILSTSADESENVVDLEVVILTEETKEALDARYGEGAVRAIGVLQPVR